MTPEEAERELVAAARAAGGREVVLCGSRATGTASETSDWDVLVAVPEWVLPLAVRRLARAEKRVAARVGAPVTLSPVPRRLLLRPPRNLFLWKVRREGRVLHPPRLALEAGPPPVPTPELERSYLVSALLFLLADPRGQAGARKAAMHLEQLDLLRAGRYDPAPHVERARWFDVRDVVATRLALRTVGRRRGGARYAALSALRGRLRVRAALSPVEERLTRAAVALAEAVQDAGVDEAGLARAAAALPPGVGAPAEWTALRDVVVREWATAHPLVAQ